jgi:hypothetical protein
MKKYLLLTLIAIFLLNACAPSALPPATETVIPTATVTFIPTSTPTPSAPTITPLPAIPTFTPTFDASAIVTVTPAPKAECPDENPKLAPDFEFPDLFECLSNEQNQSECFHMGTENQILSYLNSGGSPQKILAMYKAANSSLWKNYFYRDVTGDQVPELMIFSSSMFPKPVLFYCQEGSFRMFRTPENAAITTEYQENKDLNSNGIPEIIFISRGGTGSGGFHFTFLEWDGNEFVDTAPQSLIIGLRSFELVDREDGLSGIELQGGMWGQCCYPGEFPVRATIDTYRWDGKTYQMTEWHYDDPIFRFQAVEDGDRESLSGSYDKAFDLYQETISNKNLEWWSKERAEFTINEFRFNPPHYPDFSSPPPTEPDETAIQFEYASLASYAYYRIMLIHLVQGQESNADTAYDTLQQTFGSDPYGRPYVEMATTFRDTYQSTQKMYDGCAAAIQYAAEHPEILIPLGSDYHGAQSHTYKPEDVCPFR